MPVPARWRATRGRRRCRERAALCAAHWCLALAAADVSAQISGSASVVSNYRYRGVSLSGNDPAAQATVVYDHPQGAYAGAFGSTTEIGYPPRRELQGIFFGGYAIATPSGLTWDIGGDYTAFTGSRSYGSPEVYVGATYEGVSARAYYAPRYYGYDDSAVYAEINATRSLFDRVRLIAHAGVFRYNGTSAFVAVPARVFDGKFGIGYAFDRFDVELSWVGISSKNAGYPVTGVQSRNGPVLTVSWLF